MSLSRLFGAPATWSSAVRARPFVPTLRGTAKAASKSVQSPSAGHGLSQSEFLQLSSRRFSSGNTLGLQLDRGCFSHIDHLDSAFRVFPLAALSQQVPHALFDTYTIRKNHISSILTQQRRCFATVISDKKEEDSGKKPGEEDREKVCLSVVNAFSTTDNFSKNLSRGQAALEGREDRQDTFAKEN